MTWDYRNPSIPKKGDERYNHKFPDTYQVIDCIREHYYDYFKSDLSFNGSKDAVMYGCAETNIYAYQHSCKNFASIRDKRPVFILSLENGVLNDKNNYVEFELKSSIFETEQNKLVLEFMKRCINDITNRNFNLVLSGDGLLKFIHVPYDRKMPYNIKSQFSDMNHIYYTTEIFIDFMSRLYDNQYFYINRISNDILSRLNEDELTWINYMKSMGDTIYHPNFLQESSIEVGPKIEYVRIRK